ALGLLVAPRRRDAQRTVMLRGDALGAAAVAQHVAQLGDRARSELGDREARLDAVYELRYAGQSFELAVAGPPAPSPDELRSAFEDLHERRYGYRDPEQELELVTVRVSASVPGSDVTLGGAGAGGPRPGDTIAGPAVVALPESTLFVPDDWRGEVDANGTIHLQERA
ncbi:MAG: hypothetical protein ACRDMX_04385, partial [Solirubrobacteraceae bacterium]